MLDDDLTVRLGALELRAIATRAMRPALSWYWQSCDEEGCAATVYADSLSPITATATVSATTGIRGGVSRRTGASGRTRLHDPGDAASVRKRDARPARIRSRPVDAEACRDYAATVSERLDARLTESSRQADNLPAAD